MPQWTDEQKDAIYTAGKNILVAAAAGSGKTAVLVERIIQKLLNKENQIDIDSLLVVTFTNAAAQEMRNRVGEALAQALEKDPTSLHLKKQLSLLQHAQISTLHAFCMELVRKNAYNIDIDPSFRIADDVEGDMIRQEVLEDLFEEWYGSEEAEQAAFFDVVDRFSNDRSDLEVESLVLQLYEFAMKHPWPEAWLDNMADMYDVKEDIQEDQLPWLVLLKEEVKSELEAMEAQTIHALEITKESDGPYTYAEALDEDLRMIQDAKGSLALSWEHARQVFSSKKFKTLSRKKMDCDEAKQEQVKARREQVKKKWNKLSSEWFTRALPAHLADMHKLYPTVKHLIGMVKAFKEGYRQAKKEKGLVDFSDLEHFALDLLRHEEASVEDMKPSNLALNLQQKYNEILVDEYQDTNLVQESIITLVSNQKNNGNIFMVGDVKQSIYRFRHAEPSLFIEKYNRFNKSEDPGYRIDLARNFRSREEVLSGANFIFRQLLDEEVGEVSYNEDAELIYGNRQYDDVPLANPEAELMIIDQAEKEEDTSQTQDENTEDIDKAQIEARAYAKKIKEWIGDGEQEPLQVVDKQTGIQRNINYRDVVILMRSMTWAPTIMDEFKKQGIPVYAELAAGYLQAIEIRVMVSLLKVIDNPRQDIPLASVLRSPILDINEDDLAQIRLAKKRASYYEALVAYVKEAEESPLQSRLATFLQQLKEWRKQARQGALSELIWTIFRGTGYYDFVGGIPGGRQRQANLRALYDRARSYESTSFRGLFRFLRFIERMEEKGDDLGAAKALGEQEDVVRIMTIHKSKGLEFPAVIVGAMDKQFNQQDLREKYLLHKELGFSSKYIDPEKRIMYPTLAYHALKTAMKREMWAEEMRVLYVALTRAKEKLVMVGTVNDLDKKIEKWEMIKNHTEWTLPSHFRLDAKTYLDWVAASLIRHKSATVLSSEQSPNNAKAIYLDNSKWKITRISSNIFMNMVDEKLEKNEKLTNAIQNWIPLNIEPDLEKEKVVEKLDETYAYQASVNYRAKQSVTEIKRQNEIRDSNSDAKLIEPNRVPITRRPRFMQEEKKLSAVEIGTAMHTVMQHLPFDRKWAKEDLYEFIAQMVEKEMLTEAEAGAVDQEAILALFQTELGQRLLAVEEVHREVPFTMTLSAQEVYNDQAIDKDERVFIQGVMDCLIPDEKGWILLDYKTDTIPGEVTAEKINTLKKRYETQLNLYAEALESIWKQPITAKYLYFFDKSLLIQL